MFFSIELLLILTLYIDFIISSNILETGASCWMLFAISRAD